MGYLTSPLLVSILALSRAETGNYAHLISYIYENLPVRYILRSGFSRSRACTFKVFTVTNYPPRGTTHLLSTSRG